MNKISPYVNVRETFQLLVRVFGMLQKDGAQGCGVSVIQSHILYELGKRPNISLNDLAQLLMTDTSSLSRQVQQLVEHNLINRLPDPNDRRYVVLSLTADGEKKQLHITESMELYLQDVFASIPAEKHEQVFETLSMMNQALNSTPFKKQPSS
ncbi:DNA-binding MarR family transcriptional regulator [Paenibacillus endophyticus]|uniref:DNA-binding MarR family transcriptional regulator n=1 Tax=Paenibacillus endophyticus TaxID=1294268 RepID=A0A7W5GAJ7_9BACL|nr:MarR family winged helix-turn-helix transcriptional regulator [Paenibacillus endophyticus]MBB3152830.1 DNA-binding MarR family transcriptional regulator [Paenibacillus endophyticus]